MPDISSIVGTSTANQDVIRSLKDHIHAVDFVRYVPSEAMNIATGAVRAAGSLASPIVFLKAVANSDVRFKYERPAYWTNGVVRVLLSFNGSAGSTSAARIVYTAQSLAFGEVNPGAGFWDINGLVELVPGHATAFAKNRYTLASELAVDSSHEMLEFGLFRDGTHGSDAYAGDFQLWGAVLTYVPARQ